MTRSGRMLTAPQALDARLPPDSDEPETPLARRSRAALNKLLRLTRGVGFLEIQTGWNGRRFEIPSAEEFWELQAVFSSRARKGLSARDPAEQLRIREAFLRDSQKILGCGGSLISPHESAH